MIWTPFKITVVTIFTDVDAHLFQWCIVDDNEVYEGVVYEYMSIVNVYVYEYTRG